LNHPWLQKERLPEERPIETSDYAEMAYLVRMGVIIPNKILWEFIDRLFLIKAFSNTHFSSREQLRKEFRGTFSYRDCTLHRLIKNYLR
jgi:hypothetical protein